MIARQESRAAEQVVPEKRVVDFHVENVRPARAVEAEPLPGHVHEEPVPFPSVPAAQHGAAGKAAPEVFRRGAVHLRRVGEHIFPKRMHGYHLVSFFLSYARNGRNTRGRA